jgi:hypothetical protein
MAVEIREVVVRVVVGQDNERSKTNNEENVRELSKEAIVHACVHEVMRILKRSRER